MNYDEFPGGLTSQTMAALRIALLACVVAAASAFSAGPA
jgi:hypothetical protein